ncbi:MAG: TonB-dependent receptor [Spirochaetes bacterium]|nr:TonB-dependent receptor [Spirochaetota bacterium]
MKRLIPALAVFMLSCLISLGLHAQGADAGGTPATIDTERTDSTGIPDTAPDKEKPARRIRSDSDIVITATKTGINKRETGASVTIITAEEIARTEKGSVAEILKNQPGIYMSSNSSMGGVASLYVRGTASNQVTVLVDGVRVNDPTSPGNGFDFAHLTTENIERIEIIRGSQSTLYGSDAIGGVVNIITKKGAGKPRVTVGLEGGSFYTFRETASVSGGNEDVDYSFAASRMDSRGYDRTSSWRGMKYSIEKNSPDGYENTSASARIGVKTIRDSRLSLALRYTGAKSEIDDGSYSEDANRTYENDAFSGILAYRIPIFSWWDANLSASYMYQMQRDRDMPDVKDIISWSGISNMWYKGKRISGEFRNLFKIMDIDEITCGVSYEKEYADTMPWWWYSDDPPSWWGSMDPLSPISKSEGTWSAYLQNHLKLMDRIFIIAGIRYTRPDQLPESLDYSLSGSFVIPVTETRIKGSVTTGYKTPSLYQRYNNFERYDRFTFSYLKPERTLSVDAGVEQPFWGERIVIEATYFSIDYRNMIHYDTVIDTWGRYYNIDALTRGVECAASLSPFDDLDLRGHYTYSVSENKTFRSGDMIRRPRHRGGFSVNYAFLARGNVNLGFTYTGKRRDYFKFPWYASMDPHYRFDLALSWWIIEQLQAHVRFENLTNERYEEIYGYRQPGFACYGGLKAVF